MGVGDVPALAVAWSLVLSLSRQSRCSCVSAREATASRHPLGRAHAHQVLGRADRSPRVATGCAFVLPCRCTSRSPLQLSGYRRPTAKVVFGISLLLSCAFPSERGMSSTLTEGGAVREGDIRCRCSVAFGVSDTIFGTAGADLRRLKRLLDEAPFRVDRDSH